MRVVGRTGDTRSTRSNVMRPNRKRTPSPHRRRFRGTGQIRIPGTGPEAGSGASQTSRSSGPWTVAFFPSGGEGASPPSPGPGRLPPTDRSGRNRRRAVARRRMSSGRMGEGVGPLAATGAQRPAGAEGARPTGPKRCREAIESVEDPENCGGTSTPESGLRGEPGGRPRPDRPPSKARTLRTLRDGRRKSNSARRLGAGEAGVKTSQRSSFHHRYIMSRRHRKRGIGRGPAGGAFPAQGGSGPAPDPRRSVRGVARYSGRSNREDLRKCENMRTSGRVLALRLPNEHHYHRSCPDPLRFISPTSPSDPVRA